MYVRFHIRVGSVGVGCSPKFMTVSVSVSVSVRVRVGEVGSVEAVCYRLHSKVLIAGFGLLLLHLPISPHRSTGYNWAQHAA